MKEGFARVDREFTKVRGEMKEGFVKVDERFDRLEAKLDRWARAAFSAGAVVLGTALAKLLIGF
jgi:hypothetical protein